MLTWSPTIFKSSPSSDNSHCVQELLVVIPKKRQTVMTPMNILMAACEQDVEYEWKWEEGIDRDRQHLYETPTLAYKWGQRGVVSGSGLPVRGSRCHSQRSAPGSPCEPPRVSPEQENIKTYQTRSDQETGIIGPVSLLHS